MAKMDDDIFGSLETAIAAWNRKVGGMHENLSATLSESQARLAVLARVLADRRTLPTPLLVARAKLDAITQQPEQRAEAVNKSIARMAKLEKHLDSYQAALDALHSETTHSVAAAEALAKQLLDLYDQRNTELIEAEGPENAKETLETLRSSQE